MKQSLLLRWTFSAVFCAFYSLVTAQTTILWQMGDEDFSNPEMICSDPEGRLSSVTENSSGMNWVGTKSWNVTGWDGVTFTEINGGAGDYVDFILHLDGGDTDLYFQPVNLYISMERSGDTDDTDTPSAKLVWWDLDYNKENYLSDGGIQELVPNKAPDGDTIKDKTYTIYNLYDVKREARRTLNGGVFSIEIKKPKDNCNIGVANIVLVGYIQDEEGNNLDDFQYKISPNADDGEISRLSEITLLTNNGVFEFNDYEMNKIIVEDANGKKLAYATGYEPLKYRNGLCYGYKYTLNKDVVAAGTHTLTIPSGLLNIGYSEMFNGILTCSICIDGSEEDVDVYFEPESGTTFDQLDKITVTSDSINMNSEYSGEGIKVIDEDGNNVDVEVTVTDVSDDNAFEISFTPAITAGGEYTVKIPAGYFILGESQSHENDTLEYKCAVDYSFTTAPNNSDANFNAITVNANGKISINEDKLPEVVVKKSNGEQVTHAASYEAITDDNDKTTGYTLTLADNILVLGSYTYTIPAGLFNLGNSGKTNHELTGSAAVDGTQDDYSSLEVNLSDRESAPTELEQLSNEFSLTVSADDTYKTYDFSLVLSIDNITTGENIITADMTQSGNSDDGYTYSWTNSTAETLVAGNSYLFSVEVKTSGNDGESEVIGVFDLFTVAGTGSGWSDTKVKSISPDPENGEISLSDNVFTLTFDTDSALVVKVFADSSYVKVDENQYEFESIESDGEYSDVWTLTVSDTLMAKAAKNGGMDLVVVAKDKKGFAVGSDAETTTYSYTVAKPVISYDDSLTVDTISAITLSSDYLSLNANYEGDGILVLNGNDTVNVAVKAAKDGTTMTLSFSPAITLAGDYTIKIPEGYFLVGESQVYESDSLQLSRTIEYTFTTSPSGEISTFKEITVLSNGAIAVDTDSLPNIVVKTDAGGRVTNAASCDAIKTVNNNVLEYRFNLSDTITAGGSYTYSIPEGLLTLGGTDSKHEAISENVTVSGTSEDKAVYTITPASGATVKSMSEFTIVADRKIVMSSDDLNSTHVFYYSTNTDSNDDESTGDSQTTTRAAVLVEFASPIYDDDKTTIIGYTFTLEKEITDAGAYTISIPEGFFLVGDGDGNVTSRKLFATFNVEAATNE